MEETKLITEPATEHYFVNDHTAHYFCVSMNFSVKPRQALGEGRNGYYKQSGVQVEVSGYKNPPMVSFRGITSRGHTARGKLILPVADLPRFLEMMQRVNLVSRGIKIYDK